MISFVCPQCDTQAFYGTRMRKSAEAEAAKLAKPDVDKTAEPDPV